MDAQNSARVIAEAGLPDLATPCGPWRAPSGSQGVPQTQSGCLLRTPPLSDGNTLGWRKIQGRETNSSLAWNSGHSQGRERPAGPPWGSPGYPSLSQQGRGKSVGLLCLQKKVLTLFKNPRFCPFLFFFFKELSFHLLSWRRKKSLSKVFWISEPWSEAACQCLFGKSPSNRSIWYWICGRQMFTLRSIQ